MDYEVIRTDIESGNSLVTFIMKNTSEQRIKQETDKLNEFSKKDGTMNHYSYREIQ